MRKNVAKIVVILVLAIILIGLCFMFVGCKKPAKEPVFEIKLYDDNWEEIPKSDSGYGYVVEFEVEYDGNPKGFNAKCFVDGEEFYSYDYLNPIPDHIAPNPLSIWFTHRTNIYEVGYPIERGQCHIHFEFDKFKNNARYWTPSGRKISQEDLPRNIYKQIILIII